MKILYGVQATGNGHITRARAMCKALRKHQIDVDFIFTGRDPQSLFDMEDFGEYRSYQGLTFVTESGAVKPMATIKQNKLLKLYQDINNLDLSKYDLLLTDFEPISAWAARKQGCTSIAIGHQYAFDHAIPKSGNNPATALLMKYFAPATVRLGLHWHHFKQPILPPIVDKHDHPLAIIDNKIIVYLGFENIAQVVAFLQPFTDYKFFIYAALEHPEDRGHLHLRPLSRDGFQKDLANSNGVITNAGFELASEAIQMGKKLLVKPLKGQMEQLSNALALEKLNLGMTMEHLDKHTLKKWLLHFEGRQIIYPSVPDAIAQWIIAGDFSTVSPLVNTLWQAVEVPEMPDLNQFLIPQLQGR